MAVTSQKSIPGFLFMGFLLSAPGDLALNHELVAGLLYQTRPVFSFCSGFLTLRFKTNPTS
ncbi:MAG TPA: hypothetical protein DEP87_04800 [Candidatus Pacebacteria bacterium]|nr:hypothetical protein [Candidatus Paceibacterota bacterium]